MQIIEKIATAQHLHHNLDLVLVFKDIVEPIDRGVLADFQHFNLTLQQFNIFNGKFLLPHDLDCYFHFRSFVDPCLDHAVLTLAKCFSNFVEVCEGAEAYRVFDPVDPFFFFFLRLYIVDPALVREN